MSEKLIKKTVSSLKKTLLAYREKNTDLPQHWTDATSGAVKTVY